MTVLATETWTGTTGAAWPAQWTGTVQTGATRTIQANAGQLVTPPTGTYNVTGNTILSGMTAVADTDVTVDITVSTLNESYIKLSLRVANTNNGGQGTDGYHVELQPNANNIEVDRDNASSSTNLGNAAFTFVAGTTYHVRFAVIGAKWTVQVWSTGTAPTSGTGFITGTDGTPYTTPGVVGIGVQGGGVAGSITTTFDNLTVNDDKIAFAATLTMAGVAAGSLGGGSFSGGVTSTMTSTRTAAGVVARSTGTTSTLTLTGAAAGVVARSAGVTSTMTITGQAATAGVSLSTGVTSALVFSTTAAGGLSGTSGGVTATLTLTAQSDGFVTVGAWSLWDGTQQIQLQLVGWFNGVATVPITNVGIWNGSALT